MTKRLSPKRGLFIEEYLVDVDGNGKRAAIAAGFAEKSAAVTASRLLRDPEIAAVIADRVAKRAKKLELTGERVLQELALIAFNDPGRLYDAEGNRIPVHLLDEDTRRALASVEDETIKTKSQTVRTQRVKLADKIRAGELLGKYFKLFTDRVEGDITTAQIKLTEEERAARVSAILRRAALRVDRAEDAA